MAPTTMLGQKTTTSPAGRGHAKRGRADQGVRNAPRLDGPSYIARVTINTPAAVRKAKQAIITAFGRQIEGKGFSLIEVLSPCPTYWRLPPAEAMTAIDEWMVKTFPLGVFKDKEAASANKPRRKPNVKAKRKGVAAGERSNADATKEILLAGSGGQGVILTGKMLAQAAVAEGWNATYIPAYGAEVRGGTAHCHVKVGTRPDRLADRRGRHDRRGHERAVVPRLRPAAAERLDAGGEFLADPDRRKAPRRDTFSPSN